MDENYKIAEALFPDVKESIEDIEEKYLSRGLPEGAFVTRFAPSPTGFVHVGGIYASLICSLLALQSEGVFILRIEDTDKKREVLGGVEEIVRSLNSFQIRIDEGVFGEAKEVGKYGPYIQSARLNIYAACAKFLVQKGLAYPCFCAAEELATIREKQNEKKVRPGYYGEWAVHRGISFDEIKRNLDEGKKFVIRIKSSGNHEERLNFKDAIKGNIQFPENDLDYVLLKSDFYPTYHLAHIVDDHFMKVNLVLRGEEWLASTPLHIQMYDHFSWEKPLIGHFSTILKLDGNSKRKLSKRKDPESAVSFYIGEGFPVEAVKEYLLNLANSNFEDWRRQNPDKNLEEFKFNLSKISSSGALFNLVKLEDVSKQVVAKMSAGDVYNQVLIWAQSYDVDFESILKKYPEYSLNIFNIEKDIKGKRKDIFKWSQVKDYYKYFYDEYFEDMLKEGYMFPENLKKEDIKNILKKYLETGDMNKEQQEWFNNLKSIASEFGFASDTKAYRENPSGYKGSVGDIAMVLRVALTARTTTPDLQQVMQVMGEERVNQRLNKAINYLS